MIGYTSIVVLSLALALVVAQPYGEDRGNRHHGGGHSHNSYSSGEHGGRGHRRTHSTLGDNQHLGSSGLGGTHHGGAIGSNGLHHQQGGLGSSGLHHQQGGLGSSGLHHQQGGLGSSGYNQQGGLGGSGYPQQGGSGYNHQGLGSSHHTGQHIGGYKEHGY